MLPSFVRFALPVLLVPILALRSCTEAGSDAGAFGHARPHLRAVTLDAIEAPGVETLERLRDLGATHVTLVSFGFQPGLDVPEVRFNPGARWFSESDRGVRTIARQADSLGMGLVLKPQLWVRGGQWTADVGFSTEAAWAAWETQYRAFLLHTAQLAEEVGAALLVIGTELATPVQQRPDFWRRLIADVREVYGGRLTYAANWYGDFDRVPFWDALDYVGVQAYFPLTQANDPSLDTLKAAWTPHRAALAAVARRVRRPVLFTEVGYRSVPYAAAEPWRWPSRDEHGTVDPAPGLQARLYRAFFESVWDEPWCGGAIVWKWYPEGASHPRHGEQQHDLDFTPQGKPAEAVIRGWFGGGEF